MSTSPTQRTLALLRKQNIRCDIAERWLPFYGNKSAATDQNQRTRPGGIRKDLFGFIDIVAMDPARGIIGIQATSTGVSARRKKILEECTEAAQEWLECKGIIEIWGWRKLKEGNRRIWRPRVEEITIEDLEL